jgi:hypothetical protein
MKTYFILFSRDVPHYGFVETLASLHRGLSLA